MKKLIYLLALIMATAIVSCTSTKNAELKDGTWRATLKTDSGVEIPFNFIVSGGTGGKKIAIINGEERFQVDEITVEGDSVIIQMPLFDSEIRTALQGKKLQGKWIKHLADKDVAMGFTAEPDASWRFFKADVASKYDVSGRWSATFVSDDGKDTTVAVGEFKQAGQKVTGTFLTPTGDYRFLEGTVNDDKLYLSCFDGSHAYLFTGKLNSDNIITDGKFYSGYSYLENWVANKDANAMLPDAYSLTVLKDGYNSISFTFPDLDRKKVSLSDERFKDKVVIVQFFGSWCPNCMDETAYLAPFYEKYKDKGVEIVGLAYERSTDFEKAKANVNRLRKRFNVTYPMLITGYNNDKPEVAKSMPMLKDFVAFPTTIIIDKKGFVRNIHTGFTGPGTGKYYTQFIDKFETHINDLLNEK